MHPAALPSEAGCAVRLLHAGEAGPATLPGTLVFADGSIPLIGSCGQAKPRLWQAVLWCEGMLHERLIAFDYSLSGPPPCLQDLLFMFAEHPERWTRLPTPKAA